MIAISLVTGTWNRKKHLTNMLNSFRQELPTGLTYEIIVVDGGSTDGTLEALALMPDVTVIDGDLSGAINNFDRGARAARGRYVLLANDDIEFRESSVMPALLHLETHEDCGAVAFADNRLVDYKKRMYDVLHMPSVDGDMLVYAQVGLFRRWLGDEIGWWGSGVIDARTYGGDNYLSAGIWERGYTVDAVPGVTVHDHILRDDLRKRNENQDDMDSGFYKLYPDGVNVDSKSKPPNPDTPLPRVLYLPIYEDPRAPYGAVQRQQKRGLREALADVALVWELDYLNDVDIERKFVEALQIYRPHIILSQFHGRDELTERLWSLAQQYHNPAIRVNWNGDWWPHGLTSPEMLDLLRRFCDLQLTVNADALDTYADQGIPAAYWQIAPEPVDERSLPHHAAFDAVFLGNCNHAHEGRDALEDVLEASGLSYLLVGDGWRNGAASTLYDFRVGRAIYNTAKIAISDTLPNSNGFVSNRFFEALAGTACVFQQRVANFSQLTGLYPGVHFVEWRDRDHLAQLLDDWQQSPEFRAECERIAARGRQEALHGGQTFAARVKALMRMVTDGTARREPGGTVAVVNDTITATVGVKGRITGNRYRFQPGVVVHMDNRDAEILIQTNPRFRLGA